MKFYSKSTIAAILFISAFGIGSANAITLKSIPGVTDANMNYRINNGIATMFGHADSGGESKLVERYIAKLESVERVINLVTH